MLDVEISGRVALVTGGSTGIGRAVCHDLATAGAAAVVVNYSRSREEAAATVSELADLGCWAISHQASVSDEEAVRAMIAHAVAKFGQLDILINNAGTTVYVPFSNLDALSDQVWQDLWGVNVLGAFYCARAAATALRAAQGAIVNVASIAGHRATGSSLAYGVTKAALVQMTRGLAIALAPEVRVNAVSPGTVTSRWLGTHLGEERASELIRAEAGRVPLGRVAAPADVSTAIMGLLRADMVTGTSLVVDAGKHLLY